MNHTLYFSPNDNEVFIKAKALASVKGESMSALVSRLLRSWVSRQTPESTKEIVDNIFTGKVR